MRKSISDSTLSSTQIKILIHEGLAQLSEEDRALITALYFDNVSIVKLAKKMGVSRSTVRYRTAKAMNKLKDVITESYNQNF